MADTLSAIADLIWPLLVLGILIVAYTRRKNAGPWLAELARTRDVRAQLPGGISFEVGGQPLPAQQVVDDQRHHTEQLRQELSSLSAQVAALVETAPKATTVDLPSESEIEHPVARSVLWVDDRPTNNAYEIAALKDRKVSVELVRTTAEALRRLMDDGAFDTIVTDMHRDEDGESRPDAGLRLLRELRQRQIHTPVVVYASQAAIDRHGRDALELGAVGATASPTSLLELLAINYGPQFSRRFKRQVHAELERAGFDAILEPSDSPIDYVAQRNNERIGIDVKSWGPDVNSSRVQTKLDAIQRAGLDFPVLTVTPQAVNVPQGIRLPEGVEVLPLSELPKRLRVPARVA